MTHSSKRLLLERAFFGGVIAVGLTIVAISAAQTWEDPPSQPQWLVLAGLTILTGSFTIRIPRLSIRISVSDAFVFAAALLYSPHVPTVIVAVDSLVATFWMRPENRSVFRSAFNVSVASLSIWVAATAYRWTDSLLSPDSLASELLLPLFVLAATYFVLNSWLIAVALGLEKRTSIHRLWWTHFPWFSLNYFSGVSAAALLVAYADGSSIRTVGIILPLLLISYLTYKTSLGRVQDAQRHLDQLNELYMSTVETLAMAVDAKDQITHGHIRRVQVFAVELAKRLGVVDPEQLHAIETAALLHDMGKLAIPEHILNKPGQLTSAELAHMRRHADIGADLISSIKFPYPVVPIVRHHHEHWNGGGYPSGIAGTDIPLGARILAVVDCFDALISDRPYRPRLPRQEAFEVLLQRRASVYDPLVVDTFIEFYSEIAPLATRAGQEARSMVSTSSGVHSTDHASRSSLGHIRAAAFESSILSGFQSSLAGINNLDSLVDNVSSHLRQLTPATVFALYINDIDLNSVVCRAVAGDPQHLLVGLSIRVGERVTGWCAANRRTSINSHAYLDLGQTSELLKPSLKSTISTPLLDGDRLIGVLSAYSPTTDAFSDSHRWVFEYLAGRIVLYFIERHQPLGHPRGSIVAFPDFGRRPNTSV